MRTYWQKVKLGEVAEYINGRAFKPSEWNDKGLPIIRIQNLNNTDAAFNRSNDTYENKYLVGNGDLLVSWSASLGVYIWKGGNAWLNQHIFKVVPNVSVIDKKFLFYSIKNSLKELMSKTHGSGMVHITRPRFLAQGIVLPPLSEQRNIVSILDKANELIEKRKEAIELIDEYLKSVFLDMFGDPMTNPKVWKVQKLGDIADICSGVTKGRKLDKTKVVSVPYMRVANVQDEYIDLSEVKVIEVLPSDVKEYRLVKGDLLLTEGGDPDKLGRGGIWHGEIENCIHQNHIFRVRLRDNAIPEYMSTQIGSNRGKRYFLKSAKQTTGIATINMTQLKNFPVLLPPINKQEDYAEVSNEVSIVKIEMKNQLNLIERSFQVLLSNTLQN